jgi:hypothetical protein
MSWVHAKIVASKSDMHLNLLRQFAHVQSLEKASTSRNRWSQKCGFFQNEPKSQMKKGLEIFKFERERGDSDFRDKVKTSVNNYYLFSENYQILISEIFISNRFKA